MWQIDILKGSFPPQDTVSTRAYINKCYRLFELFNDSSGVDPHCYRELIQIMQRFDDWYKEVKESCKRGTSKIEHWRKFIPRITHKDLTRTIRAFLGVVQLNHPDVQVIPKTMCQDDVENYFSLQRTHVAGGRQTLQFFESSASLTKEMLISSEMNDLTDTLGSYAGFSSKHCCSSHF